EDGIRDDLVTGVQTCALPIFSLPQFIDGVVCLGSYRRGDPLWDIAHRRLQNTNGLRPLRSSPFVICYGHGHRPWHQDAIRLFGRSEERRVGNECSTWWWRVTD